MKLTEIREQKAVLRKAESQLMEKGNIESVQK